MSRTEYWEAKFARNKRNDLIARKALASTGWRVLVVWECQIRNPKTTMRRIRDFLAVRPSP